MDAPSFKNYDDAKGAERIFEDYREDLRARRLLEKALKIVGQHKTCDSLDLTLDNLISIKRRHSIRPSPIDYK